MLSNPPASWWVTFLLKTFETFKTICYDVNSITFHSSFHLTLLRGNRLPTQSVFFFVYTNHLTKSGHKGIIILLFFIYICFLSGLRVAIHSGSKFFELLFFCVFCRKRNETGYPLFSGSLFFYVFNFLTAKRYSSGLVTLTAFISSSNIIYAFSLVRPFKPSFNA